MSGLRKDGDSNLLALGPGAGSKVERIKLESKGLAGGLPEELHG